VSSPNTLVLLVEDDASTREFMAKALAKHGIESVEAASVGEALLRLDEVPAPTALILDLMLPDAKGTVLLRRIRRDALALRVAVVTGTADLTQFSDLLRFPPDAVFRKPLDLAPLLAWLRAGA
jgi:DNA-binding response OmpR family regulator